ncbi:Scr1 family TA system antitoxin-like transcriptional regulator [Lentzea kentuckyensis]|uniref:Scr1 family TA system antitoxin-like transcriptional regulator n=1 Tax=Lentzea kentuckyensis TaxID=360086 RepID=UPI00117A0E46|nr:Scr1 family TA system antitoxin-like transcriptional regulator [Lentzea kentuckyensis]
MIDQLVWLIDLAQCTNVEIQVARHSAGRLATASSFSILTFREDRFDDIVYIENPHSSIWLEDKEAREPYALIFDRLAEDALSVEDSIEHIVEALHLLQAISVDAQRVVGTKTVSG